MRTITVELTDYGEVRLIRQGFHDYHDPFDDELLLPDLAAAITADPYLRPLVERELLRMTVNLVRFISGQSINAELPWIQLPLNEGTSDGETQEEDDPCTAQARSGASYTYRLDGPAEEA